MRIMELDGNIEVNSLNDPLLKRDVLNLCRLCANAHDNFWPIFSGEGLANNISEKLQKYLPFIKVAESDELPSQICYQCATVLIQWHYLYEGCSVAEERLRGLLDKDEKISDEPMENHDDFRDDIDFEEPVLDENENANSEIKEEKISDSDTEKDRNDLSKNVDETEIIRKEKTSRQVRIREPVTATDGILNTKIFSCSECNETFNEEETLVCHQRAQHNQAGEFACKHCDEKFTSDKLLKRHLSSSHRKKRVNNDADFLQWLIEIEGQKYLKCDQCNYNSLWHHKSRFLEHYRIHTGEKPFTCDLCKKPFRTKTLLAKHVNAVHEGIKAYPCKICGRRFSDKRYVIDHTRIHTNERPYICDLCGKSFRQSGSLFIHKELHKGLRKYPCDRCPSKFTTRSSLNMHIKRHVGERNFVCATCGKAFVDGKHLRDHMTVHSDERPFPCQLCDRKFKLLKHLKQHGRTHR